MTVQVDSQPVTDQTCGALTCVISIIPFPVKKRRQHKGTHYQTCYVHLYVCQRQQCVCPPSNVYQISAL